MMELFKRHVDVVQGIFQANVMTEEELLEAVIPMALTSSWDI